MANVRQVKEGVYIYTSSMADEISHVKADMHAVVLDTFFAMCGCYAFRLTEEGVKSLQVNLVDAPTVPIGPGDYVVLLDEFSSVLTEEEREAVVQHELAHIEAGHTEIAARSTGILLDLEMELEADRMAAAIVGKRPMREALVKLIARSRDLQFDILTFAGIIDARQMVDDSYNNAINHPITVQRLAALQ